MTPAKSSFLSLAVLVLAHIGLSLGYAVVVPPLNWPDEPAHLSHAQRFARGEGWAHMIPDSWSSETLEPLIRDQFRDVSDPLTDPRLHGVDYQAHQPPGFYALAGLVLSTTGSLFSVRLMNLALSSLSLVLLYRLALQLGFETGIALTAVGSGALLPSRAYFAVSVGNDPSVELVFTTFFLLLTRRADASGTPWRRRAIVLGSVLGAGLWIKASALLLAPLQAAWLALSGRSLRRSIASMLLTLGIAVVVASPWLSHNVRLYGWGDPLAVASGALGSASEIELGASGELTPRPTLRLRGEHGLLQFLATLFVSLWGVFGWMQMWPGPGLIGLYTLLSVLALAGLARHRAEERRVLLWALSCVGLGVLAVVVYGLFDYQAQGRYLLVVSAPLALLVGLGWSRTVQGRGRRIVPTACLLALLVANLYCLRYTIPWYLNL